jgi:hypothetical protein
MYYYSSVMGNISTILDHFLQSVGRTERDPEREKLFPLTLMPNKKFPQKEAIF